MVSSSPTSALLLTEPQIEVVVQRYVREMARFEKTASAVADRARAPHLRATGSRRRTTIADPTAQRIPGHAHARPRARSAGRHVHSGSICEVQVATVAAHLFNELEHDITYKKLGHAATGPEQPAPEALGVRMPSWRGCSRSSASRLAETWGDRNWPGVVMR